LVERCSIPFGFAERVNFIDMISRCVTSKGLRQFHCPAQHFETVLDCFKEAFPRNTRELHRLDCVTQKSKLSSAATLPTVFFHVEAVSDEALAIGRHHPSVHLFCGVQNPYNAYGRHVHEEEGFRLWSSMESWIAQPPESSLPCLPTTL